MAVGSGFEPAAAAAQAIRLVVYASTSGSV